MALRDLLKNFVSTRRALRDLHRIADSHEQQTALLRRLVDHFAPSPAEFSPADLKSTGVSFNKDDEQAKILAYVEQCERDLKRTPTEEEIVDYLDGVERRF